MTEIQRLVKIKILKELLKEYELLAKYNNNGTDYDRYCALDMAIKELEQKPKAGQFAKWVANEIFDDMWEYNKDAFAEIACRKLEKLGIVKASGDVWELVKQESEEV